MRSWPYFFFLLAESLTRPGRRSSLFLSNKIVSNNLMYSTLELYSDANAIYVQVEVGIINVKGKADAPDIRC